MSGDLISGIGLLLFMLFYRAIFELLDRLYFYYANYPKIKKEWTLLTEALQLTTESSSLKESFLKGFRLKAEGRIQGSHIELNWKKNSREAAGLFTGTIELRNPREMTLELSKTPIFFGEKVLEFETPYFKENFNLSTNDISGISAVFDEATQNKVRKFFALQLKAKLLIETKKKTNKNNDTILDFKNSTSTFTYSAPDYQINNKRERLFVEATILSMFDIAKKIDAEV